MRHLAHHGGALVGRIRIAIRGRQIPQHVGDDVVLLHAAVVRKMTHEQVEEGQALSAKWKPGTPLPRQSKTGAG